MRLASIQYDDHQKLCLWAPSGLIPLEQINRHLSQSWPDNNMLSLIQCGALESISQWYREEGKHKLDLFEGQEIERSQVKFLPLYLHPGKIWGVGLNYKEHADDLSEKVPVGEPASFMKPDTTIIGHGDSIKIPVQSLRTTAEGELGVIIGKRCKDIDPEDWLEVVAGFTSIVDVTAEDILRRNPRYLTLSKSFDTFFSFGPVLVTPDEIENIEELRVSTIINGFIHAENVVANMTFSPAFLVSFHSRVMTLLPGDIISTGTPGATVILHGDEVECRIDGFEPLVNPVRDLKIS